MAQIIHIIDETEEGLPIKTIVRTKLHVSNTRFSRMKYNGGVLLDGSVAYANDAVRAGQTLTLIETENAQYIPEGFVAQVPIVYEDEHLYIVNKPAPMACQTGTHKMSNTLENAMYTHFGQPHNFIFRPVNRLDKGTSGLMAVAKSGYVHALMQKQLHTPDFVRTYLAVTEGVPKEKEGIIRLKIGREADSIVKRCIADDGKEAVTHYCVMAQGRERSLIRLQLETGRTHQIRVHLSALGCPVCGDYLYGKELPEMQGRFALHSHEIAFTHPVTGEQVKAQARLDQTLESLIR